MKRFAIVALLLMASSLQAATIRVPQDQPTIQAGINPRDIVPESSKHPLTDVQLEQLNRNKPKSSGSAQSALGFLASPGILVGNTAYDIQHNSRMARQIVQGPNNRVHLIWTHKLAGVASTEREIRYGSYVPNVGLSDLPGGLTISDGRQGHMCALDQYGNSALATWRYGAAFAAYRATSALDSASGAGSFTIVDVPSAAVTCEGIFSEAVSEPYIWPVVAADNDGSANPLVHIVGMEGNSGSGYGCMAYYRGTGGFTNYGTCGKFIDSTTSISYTIAQDPGSDKVAIAYSKARTATTSRENNDVCYRMSNDLGVTWDAVVNVTNYASATKERASQETSSLFSADGCYHIIYVAAFYDTVQLADQEARLYHWDDCSNCKSLILDANNFDANCNMKAFEHNVTRISLSECTVGATKTLYAVYTRYVGDTDPATAALPDCSFSQYPNGEIYASVSSTGGETWGPPVNLTNSRTDNCAAGYCDDDNFSSSAMYVTDSLRIEYLNDKEAGSGVAYEATAETYSPVMFLSVPCFAMDTYRFLTSTPADIVYPDLHAITNQVANTSITLLNGGNSAANWTRTIVYTVGSNWLTVPASGTVTPWCANSQVLAISAGPLATQGLYTAKITFSYEGPTSFEVPVEFYVFDSWFLPQDQAIRTELVRMNVNQAGRNSHQVTLNSFYSFTDSTEPMYDGSLVLGNSATNMSWLIFDGGGGGNPTPSNPFGHLYALSNTTYDSTSNSDYRFATGKGTNGDSSLQFDVTWYSPKHPDSSTFIVASYSLYKGDNNPSGSVTNLTVGYASDFDVADDSLENIAGFDNSRQTIYQTGHFPPDDLRYAGIRGVLKSGAAVTGGFAWENDRYVYPQAGFENDSLWNKLQAVNGFAVTDSTEDLSSVLTIVRGATINGAANDTLHFAVLFVGTNGVQTLANFQNQLDRAKAWLCGHVYAGSDACADCLCGDADGSGIFTVSDAVKVINYIFAGGAAPNPICLGDADGSGIVTISDAVRLINYIFAGGTSPVCR